MNNKMDINLGDIHLNASNFRIDNESSEMRVLGKDAISISWDLEPEESSFFKNLIHNENKKNLSKCKSCEYFRLIFENDLTLSGFECKLGATYEDMVNSRTCIRLMRK